MSDENHLAGPGLPGPGASADAGNDGGGRLVGGRYRLRTRIGRGGMASVFRATDEALGRDVALKLFAPHLADDDERRRQRSETAFLAQFNHPGLVTLFDAGVDPGSDGPQIFLVMELVEGPDLRRRLGDGPLSVAETAQIGIELAAALAYVHGRGVIHRDVKPANVLLGGEASGAKLADFGIARIVEGTRLTATGTTIGTATYLSPEQATGSALSPASDIYSLGLVLLECLTGRVEYPGTAVESSVARLQRQPAIPEGLPATLVGLLAAMTVRDPGLRPAAGQVGETLRTVLAGGSSMPARAPGRATAPAEETVPLIPAPTAQLTRQITADPVPQPPASDSGRPASHLRPPVSRARPPASGARRTRHLQTRWIGAAIGLVLFVSAGIWLVAALSAPSTAGSPQPYPTVSGTLGAHLEQLQKSVEP